jgi:5-methyltetrahydrofolate--homocysteine methyltransferase
LRGSVKEWKYLCKTRRNTMRRMVCPYLSWLFDYIGHRNGVKMNNTYCENWERVKERFTAWWAYEPIGYPLMRVAAAGKPTKKPAYGTEFTNLEDRYVNTAKIMGRYRDYCETHWLLEDSFPAASLNLGPGSMALYLGSEPIFRKESLWYKECVEDWESFGDIKYDPDNKWWRLHLEMHNTARSLAGDDFLVAIPDIIENLDIVSALRGPQNLCYDLMDKPQTIRDAVGRVDDLYFQYYDAMYDIVKEPDGSSAYTAFNIWGHGRTAKIQCDFCAMISPDQFRDFAQPSLWRQCRRLDNSIYHLDGPDAIRHVPALMEIKELNGLQWTCGDGQPDGGSERWYPIYDQVREAGKSLWVAFGDGGAKDWVESGIRLMKRYGPDCFYFIFPDFSNLREAEEAAAAIRNTAKGI